jgi:ABC-type branched-subunit amino acid transport system substrate-binding protein
MPTLGAAGIPVVSPSNADPTLTGVGVDPRTRPYPTYFRLSGTDELQARVAADYAVHTLGRRRIAVVDDEPRYGTTLGDRFAAHAAALGASIMDHHLTRADGRDDPDVADIATSLEQEAPDLVYVTTGADFAGKLRARLAGAGMSIQVLGSDALLQPRYTAEAKSAADGDLITSLLVPPTRLPAAGAFVATYSQRYGGPADDDGSTSTTPSGALATDLAGSAGADHSGASPAGSQPAGGQPAGGQPAGGRRPSTEPPAAAPSTEPAVRQRQAAHDAAVELAQRRAEAIPAVAAYAYDAARAIIRAAAAVLPGRTAVDAAVRHDIAAAIGRGTFAGVSGPVAFDRWGDIRTPGVVLYTVLGGRFVALTTRTP